MYYSVVKEWRAFDSDEFVDGEEVTTYSDITEAVRTARHLNWTEADAWDALDGIGEEPLWEYTSFCVAVHADDGTPENFIEADTLGMDKNRLR